MMPSNGTGCWSVRDLVEYLNRKRDPSTPEWTYMRVWRWGKAAGIWEKRGRTGRLVATAKSLRRGAPEVHDRIQQEAWERAHGLD